MRERDTHGKEVDTNMDIAGYGSAGMNLLGLDNKLSDKINGK